MFETASRYATIPDATLERTLPDGTTRTIRYRRRRFLPPAASLTPLTRYVMTDADRLDIVAARYVGDPTAFWRLCDSNDVLRPSELEVVGRPVVIAMPRP
jgi:hypothetical protein